MGKDHFVVTLAPSSPMAEMQALISKFLGGNHTFVCSHEDKAVRILIRDNERIVSKLINVKDAWKALCPKCTLLIRDERKRVGCKRRHTLANPWGTLDKALLASIEATISDLLSKPETDEKKAAELQRILNQVRYDKKNAIR